jgi:hypothetical protein
MNALGLRFSGRKIIFEESERRLASLVAWKYIPWRNLSVLRSILLEGISLAIADWHLRQAMKWKEKKDKCVS